MIDVAEIAANMPDSGRVDVTLTGMTVDMIAALNDAIAAGHRATYAANAPYAALDALVDAICNGLNGAGLPA